MYNLIRISAFLLVGLVLSQGLQLEAKGPRTILEATLVKSATAPAAAKGKGKYDVSASRTNLSVEGQGLAALNGRVADVLVNGTHVGSGNIALGRFKLELSTERRQTVPSLSAGATIEVLVGGQRILSGNLK